MENESSTSVIGSAIREKIEARRRDAEAIMEECDIVEEAWTDWDVCTLLQMRYITPRQAEEIEREMREDEDVNSELPQEFVGKPGDMKFPHIKAIAKKQGRNFTTIVAKN